MKLIESIFFFYLLFLASFSFDNGCDSDSNCSYRISRPSEDRYLIIKNIMENLIVNHWNVTVDFTNFYMKPNIKQCDQYFDQIAIKDAINKDYRHPNALFKNIPEEMINQTIKTEYLKEWFEVFKFIKYDFQSKTYREQCNNLGLKLFLVMYKYPEKKYKILRCNTRFNQEDSVTHLVDFYVAQSFLKNCMGNVELIAKSIYKLIKYDCERASTFRLAYFNSKFINMFRTCSLNLTANDLMLESSKFTNCSNTTQLNSILSKKYCSWFEIVCKYPIQCIKSMKWSED